MMTPFSIADQLRYKLLGRILDIVVTVDLGRNVLSVLFVDAADIDGLYDVVGLFINGDSAARAGRAVTFDGIHEGRPVGVAVGLGERFGDQGHRVIGGD